ncbi:hypothetical protein L0Y46_01315 [bacterium]|nr:hypothetical protein [bacterium]
MKNQRIKKRAIVIFVALVCFFAVSAGEAEAQTLFGDINKTVSLTSTPRIPGSNEEVLIEINSVLANLGTSLITWYVNDRIVLSGYGEQRISVRTGNPGSASVIRVSILSAGSVLEASMVIRPTIADVIWEADTYTPPFYRGKALPSTESKIKLWAVPDIRSDSGARVSSNNLVYEWRINGLPVREISGYGKNAAFIQSGYLGQSNVAEVVARTSDGVISASGKSYYQIVEPWLVFYEKNSLTGILFNTMLGNDVRLSKGDSIILRAVPYFFDRDALQGSNAAYTWKLDRDIIDRGTSPSYEISISSGENAAVSGITVEYDIDIEDRLLQSASQKINVRYDE